MRKRSESNHGPTEYYTGQAGHDYFASQKTIGQFAAEWNRSIFLPYITETSTLLDFGCGGGDLLARLPGQRKVGVEINPAARAYAEALGIQTFAKLDELPPLQVDVVISSHALEHVAAPLKTLRKLRHYLVETGLFLLLLPLDDWRSQAHRTYHANDVHHHLYGWTPQNLGNLLTEAGFMVEKVEVLQDAMPPRPGIARWAMRSSRLRKLTGTALSRILKRPQLFAICHV